jgi:hypothetical protein
MYSLHTLRRKKLLEFDVISSHFQLVLLYTRLPQLALSLFLAHVVSSLAYPNLLRTKRLNCCYCITIY